MESEQIGVRHRHPQMDLYGPMDHVDRAIKDIRARARTSKLCVRFSGGKDSIVLKRLMDLAGAPFEVRFSRTSVDPPELLHGDIKATRFILAA